MPKDETLKPDDFPVHADRNKIVKSDGKPLAETLDEKTAKEIAERLNSDEQTRDEDRWSA
jgi:hypothetical protein